jgi:hypothetical protein
MATEEFDESTLTKELKEKYPLLFYKEEQESRQPISLFGVETNPGWDLIIRSMCHLMYRQYRITKRNCDYWVKKATEEGNTEEIQRCKELLEKAEQEVPKICQIKEKFGTLRVYVDNLTPYVDGVIDMAEAMSEVTCEKCGKPGETYTIGWHKTLCLDHARERYGKVVDIPKREDNNSTYAKDS